MKWRRTWAPALGLLLLVSQAAAEEPLGRWLGALPADTQQVLLVPRLDRLSGPATAGLERLRRHEGLARWLAAIPELPAGLRPEGPLLLARTAAGDRLGLWPVSDAAKARGALVPEGEVAVTRQGMLAVGPRASLVLAGSAALPPPHLRLDTCPRPPGEADAFLLGRMEGGTGCLTARVDADRIRVDARVAGLGQGWLRADPALLAYTAGARVAFAVRLGPRPVAALRARFADAGPRVAKRLLARFDGRVLLLAGPTPLEWTVAMGVRDPATAWDEVAFALRGFDPSQEHPDVRLEAAEGGFRVRVLKPRPGEPSELWFVRRGDLIVATTRADRLAAPPRGGLAQDVSEGRIQSDPALFRGAPALLHLRLEGPPQATTSWAERLAPAIGALGLEASEVLALGSAAAWALAHVGELTVRVDPSEDGLKLALELVTL